MSFSRDLLLVRHGQTVSNAARRMQGQTDSALTDLGRAQASAMGVVLAGILDPDRPVHLRYSPIGRVRHTLVRILDAAGLPKIDPIPDDRLKEIHFGAWAGFSVAELESGPEAEAWERRQKDPWTTAAPGGESYAELSVRVNDLLLELEALPTDHQIVLVCHGGTGRVIRGPMTGIPRDEWPFLHPPQNGILRLAEGTERLHESDIASVTPFPDRPIPTASPPPEIVLRSGTQADAEGAAAIERAGDALFAGNGISFAHNPDRDDTAVYVDAAARGDLLVAELAGRMVGFLAMGSKDGLPFIIQVSVHGDAGGSGIGRALVVAALRRAALTGAERLLLTTFTDVSWNGPWYRSLGFIPVPDEDLGQEILAKLEDERARLQPYPRCAMEFWL